MPIPPANLRSLAARNDGAFPSERVMTTIYGCWGEDDQALMPSFETALDGPQVNWSASDGHTVPTPEALVAPAGYLSTLQDR
ncbi:hypothetical protein ACFQBU_00520 [Jhaorihella thermophila]